MPVLCDWAVKRGCQQGSAFEEIGSTGLQFLWKKNDKLQSLNKLGFKYIYEMLPITDESLKDLTSFSIPTALSLCLYCWSYFLVRSLIVCPSSHWTGITFLVGHFRAYLPPTPHPPPLQYSIFFFPGSKLNKHFFQQHVRWDGQEFWSFSYI